MAQIILQPYLFLLIYFTYKCYINSLMLQYITCMDSWFSFKLIADQSLLTKEFSNYSYIAIYCICKLIHHLISSMIISYKLFDDSM